MPVTIDDSILTAAHLDESSLKRELAILLFQQERLTLGQASKLAGVGQLEFQSMIADRGITIHYGVTEFREDTETLRRLGQI